MYVSFPTVLLVYTQSGFIFLILCADGQFKKSVIAKFVSANKLPLVTTFSRESAPLIFESPIKKQVSNKIGFGS